MERTEVTERIPSAALEEAPLTLDEYMSLGEDVKAEIIHGRGDVLPGFTLPVADIFAGILQPKREE